jgi:phenylalanyl-tRNA synthetase alpha subunit
LTDEKPTGGGVAVLLATLTETGMDMMQLLYGAFCAIKIKYSNIFYPFTKPCPNHINPVPYTGLGN